MIVLFAASAASYCCTSLKEHGGTSESGARQPGLPVNTKRDLPGGGQISAFEFLTNPDDLSSSGGTTRRNPKWHAFPRSQAHDRAIESTICLCGPRLTMIDPTMILLPIAAIIAPVVWERFLLQDCVIKHHFVGGEKPREREVDRRCQGELVTRRYRNECQLGHGNQGPTHPEQVDTHVFMLLMSPGKVSGTETVMAAAARQFSKRLKGQIHDPRSERYIYIYTFHEADTSRKRRHECGVQSNTKQRRRNWIRILLPPTRIKRVRRLASVTMIPVRGPRKTV